MNDATKSPVARTRSLLTAFALCVTVVVAPAPVSADDTVFAARVDAAQTTAPRWVSTIWTPTTSAPTTLTLSWQTTANLRIELRNAATGQWVGAVVNTDKPKRLTANVTAGTNYRIAVWAVAGAADFTVTIPSPPDPEPGIFAARVDAAQTTAPRWVSTIWTPTTTAPTTLTLSWQTTANLRIELRNAATGQWVGAVVNTDKPKRLTANVTAGTNYRIAVWAVAGAADFTVTASGQAPVDDRPNILIIMTDDQRRDSMEALPKIRSWMANGGTTYTEGFVNTPSCCPSRTSVMTGQYIHSHGTITQAGPAFDENTGIARRFQSAGYTTAHIGKYVNYYKLSDRAPYWDRWTQLTGGYINVPFNFDGSIQSTTGYSTNIIFDKAVEYASGFETNDNRPWLLQVTPTAPHRSGNNPPPAEPAYASAPVPPWIREPRNFEANTSDKPPFIYCCPGATTPQQMEATRTGMLRALYSVDDGVDELLTHLETLGELENTLVFFTSDNGWLFGDHYLHEKFVPYENSVGVPFFVRWPGHVTAGISSDRMVSTLDILPTSMAAAGIPITADIDGRDILNSPARTRRLTEYEHDAANIDQIPDWASLTTADIQYNEWYAENGNIIFREYYNLVVDPYQLTNLLADGNPNNDPTPATLNSLAAQLAADRNCSGSACP